jgi:hypothetical protein
MAVAMVHSAISSDRGSAALLDKNKNKNATKTEQILGDMPIMDNKSC